MATVRSSARLREKELESSKIPPALAKPKALTSKRGKKQKTNESSAASKPAVSWARIKGRRGHLKMVVEMPFDILLEIFQYLLPLDLLHLSRASRSMRALVMDRSVAFPVWKNAFALLDHEPPTCPENLTLPQYANFLFGKDCFYCSSIHGVTRSYTCYVRVCKECFPQQFIELRSGGDRWDNMLFNIVLRHVQPKNGSYLWRTSFSLRVDYDRHLEELKRLERDQALLDDYMKKTKEESSRIMDKALKQFLTWERTMEQAKRDDVETRRKNRLNAILDKLHGLGYKKELDRISHHAASTLPGMGGLKPLTEREWVKLGPELVEVLEELRETFARKDRKSLIMTRTYALDKAYRCYISQHRNVEPYAPRYQELAKLEPFRTLIYGHPKTTTVSPATFIPLLDDVPKMVEAWRESTTKFLINLLPQPPAKSNGKAKAKAPALDIQVLDRATTLFVCTWCFQRQVYPNVLRHDCLVRRHGRESEDEDPDVIDPNCSWNEGHDQVEFDEMASGYATEIITALGKDPNTVTWKELDKANQRVECLRCRKESGKIKRLVMTWRCAILHELERHTEDDEESTCKNGWQLLDRNSLFAAYAKEAAKGAPRYNGQIQIRCVACEHATVTDAGIVSGPSYGWSVVDTAAVKCKSGHDLSVMGTFQAWYLEPFKNYPLQVKIA